MGEKAQVMGWADLARFCQQAPDGFARKPCVFLG